MVIMKTGAGVVTLKVNCTDGNRNIRVRYCLAHKGFDQRGSDCQLVIIWIQYRHTHLAHSHTTHSTPDTDQHEGMIDRSTPGSRIHPNRSPTLKRSMKMEE
ncbi:hypothetical protein NPIL_674561 [Nephila pilipes]|uniref:Uncharacterized protein n=1 Tax=Nephila pilipes TaxID=299642 RepID=A0A8X6QKM9_NEPPI|nr:hypothetical protein NPIL_674561 [Nephila pilipes]